MFLIFLTSILNTIEETIKYVVDSFYFILEMDEIKGVRLCGNTESSIKYSIW